MAAPLKRKPRNWKANGFAYVGHAAQGLVCGLFMPFFWAPYLYAQYQRAEYESYYNRNKDGDFLADDFVSRDLADWLLGNYIGSIISASLIAVLILL